MKTTYRPEYDQYIRSRITLAEASRMTGIGAQTIANWRRRIREGRPMPKDRYHTDYDLIDRLLAEPERKSYMAIAKIAGCSETAVSRRANGVSPGGEKRSEVIETKEPPLIPPLDRPKLALARKTRGWTPQHREAFLHSPEGARWAAEITGAA